MLEHPPVFTRGRRSAEGELLHDEAFYRARGIDVVGCDRGGRITYHGPGQLVGYPIMRIDDVGGYLRAMESAIVAALASEGVTARSRRDEGADFTGVWVAQRKVASIMRVRQRTPWGDEPAGDALDGDLHSNEQSPDAQAGSRQLDR